MSQQRAVVALLIGLACAITPVAMAQVSPSVPGVSQAIPALPCCGGPTEYATSTSISSSANPSAWGSSITLTAKVTPYSATVPGTVQFFDGSGAISSALALTTNGVATYTTSSLSGGSHSLTAAFSGSENAKLIYDPSTSSALVQVVNPVSQTISVTTPAPASAAYNSQFSVVATASSGLTVTYGSSGGCTNAGAAYAMTSGTTACTVTYSQAGNTNYSAASNVTNTTNATRASQTINFPNPGTQTFGRVMLEALASSDLAVTYTVISGPATVSGSTLTITAAGTIVLAANQAGNSNYSAAATVTQSFTSVPPAPAISQITPATGLPGTLVTIKGTYFGGTTGTVTIDSLDAAIATWGPSSITLWVPSQVPSGNVPVIVVVDSQPSNTVNFQVGQPSSSCQ